MKILFIKEDNIDHLKEKIYIYGAGTLGRMVARWLKEHGINRFFFCADDEYVSQGSDIVPWSKCENEILSENADCVFAVGESSALEQFELRKIPYVYTVYNPYHFWTYPSVAPESITALLDELDDLYYDAPSRDTVRGYLEAMRTGDASAEMKNCPPYPPYFNELTEVLGEGVYIDCGAFNGDTIDAFQSFYQDFDRKIIALEPDSDSYALLKEKFYGKGNIVCLKKGAWNENTTIGFRGGDGQRSEVSPDSSESIEVLKIDDIAANDKVAFIKIGNDFTLQILEGCRETIQRDSPVVVMAACHRFEVLRKAPEFFKSFHNKATKYRIYLRHHSRISCGLLLLYAIPEKMGIG